MDEVKYEKVIFVTGGAGFIGSNYLNKFVPRFQNYFFLNIDCLTYAGSLSNVTVGDAHNYVHTESDIREIDELKDLFEKYRPDAVLHFAAESHVDMSIIDPDIFIRTNIIGTHNLLLLSKKFNIKRFHQVSTDEVYGALAMNEESFTEKSPLLPRNPYSASKASADMFVKSYYETFGLPVVITRSCNVFGPNQDRTKLIPSFVSKLAKDEKVPLYSKGEQVREWIYVEDCINAIQKVFENGKNGEIYNIATGIEYTNIELTRQILSRMGKDESYIDFVPDRKGHDFRYSLDSSKIRSELGWMPRVSFEDGLQRVIEFNTQTE